MSAYACLPRPNNFENCSCEAGEVAASERLACTCSTLLIPTRAVVMPGVERTNCSARSASVFNPSAAATNGGRPLDSLPCSMAALATSVMDEFGDILYNVYGSTEVALATVATPRDLRAAPGTAGRPPHGTSPA